MKRLLTVCMLVGLLLLPSVSTAQTYRGPAQSISSAPSGSCNTDIVVVVNDESVGNEGKHYCCNGGTWTSCDVGAGGGAGDVRDRVPGAYIIRQLDLTFGKGWSARSSGYAYCALLCPKTTPKMV